MVSYFVRYRGQPADPSAFMAHYRERHAAILQRLPQIASLVLHTPIGFHDPFPVRPAGSTLLAQMIFADSASLATALQSAARAEARDDFARLGAFNGEITHEALAGQVIF